jgi:hypothetical protein
MDHAVNWEAISAIGQLVGALETYQQRTFRNACNKTV